MSRKAHPSDVSDDEGPFVAACLTLMREDAPQRAHRLREVFNGVRWIIRRGSPWPLPHDLPPWEAVYQQAQRWLKAGVFEALVHDLRALLRLGSGRHEQPSAAIFDCRTLQSSPESGARAMMEPNGAKAAKCTWRWTPWAICWRCT
jgi:transposase